MITGTCMHITSYTYKLSPLDLGAHILSPIPCHPTFTIASGPSFRFFFLSFSFSFKSISAVFYSAIGFVVSNGLLYQDSLTPV